MLESDSPVVSNIRAKEGKHNFSGSSGQPTPGTGQSKRPMMSPPDMIPSGTSNISVSF